jgi:hypothetical protein
MIRGLLPSCCLAATGRGIHTGSNVISSAYSIFFFKTGKWAQKKLMYLLHSAQTGSEAPVGVGYKAAGA